MADDAVEAAVAAYLEHLENGGTEPSLDHLTPQERTEAAELIDLIRDARGVDFHRSRPSLDAILADTVPEAGLDYSASTELSFERVRTEIISSLGSVAEAVEDVAARSEGIRSDVIVRFKGLRIRAQFRHDITNPTELFDLDPRASAAPVFGRFPDTAAVVAVIGDTELSSVAILPFDIDEFIGAPDGDVHQPRITWPVLSLFDTLRLVVEKLAPDLTADDVAADRDPVDLDGIVRNECDRANAGVVAEGRKARTEAKKETWATFDQAAFLTGLVKLAATGDLSEAELAERLTPAEAA